MFDTKTTSVELRAGEAERHQVPAWTDEGFDEWLYQLTNDPLDTDTSVDERHFLPALDKIATGPYLAVLLEFVDRSRLNGFDLVRLLQARERMVSHLQAGSIADCDEIAHASPGDADSAVSREQYASEFAADELRPALGLTRRAAEYRMAFAQDLYERLPRVWKMLSDGLIDLARARVISDGTAHLDDDLGRHVAEVVVERARRLTTGQLAAWIRRLCVESDPEKAKKRVEHAHGERRLVIEATPDGTANLYLLDISIDDAKAIGKRVNAHAISLRKDGDSRPHDNLRADILRDLILGSDPTFSGRGIFDMRVAMTTLAELDEKAAEIPGMGPVVADVARRFADIYPRSEWRATITDDFDNPLAVVVTRRRPNGHLSRNVQAIHPTCSFPGCRMPTGECDLDHYLPWSQGGPTSTDNLGPKCRHDHQLKDHGWTHQQDNQDDIWTSPTGHTYTTEKPP